MKDITAEEAVQIMRNHICWIENKTVKQAIEKVLDELETLQNGFNTAVEHQTELIRENSHLRYELFNNQKELEKKDKIINAMAEMLVRVPENGDDLQTLAIQHFLNEHLEEKKEELKQYFERKIENG